MANQQITSGEHLYLNNMTTTWVSNTTLAVGVGYTRNSTNIADMYLAATTTINAAVNGVNGLDTGSLANNTWYYVFAIGKSYQPIDNTPYVYTQVLLSASATAPTLPVGYDIFRLIDVQLTDGSAHLLLNYNCGDNTERTKYWDAPISVLSAGAATTNTLFSLNAGVPPLGENLLVLLGTSFNPASAGNSVTFTYPGSASGAMVTMTGVVAGQAQTLTLEVLTGVSSSVQKCQYKNSVGSCTTSASVIAFRMSL